jgi:hypothetical protein
LRRRTPQQRPGKNQRQRVARTCHAFGAPPGEPPCVVSR